MKNCNEVQGFFNLSTDFLFPIIVATVTYLFISKADEWKKRRSYSRLGVAILKSLMEEISTGIYTMETSQQVNTTIIPNPLPRKSWNGMTTIPDDVLLRILQISKNVTPVGFPINEIRIHCKNYFDHMCTNWDQVPQAGLGWRSVAHMYVTSGYIDAAKGVLGMLNQTTELLESNSKKWFPR
jgi:hypothetical protein